MQLPCEGFMQRNNRVKTWCSGIGLVGFSSGTQNSATALSRRIFSPGAARNERSLHSLSPLQHSEAVPREVMIDYSSL